MENATKEKSALTAEKKPIESIVYTQTEEDYVRALKKRLEEARNQRESNHDELDGMTYSEYYEANEKSANTYIAPKKDKYDNNFVSGTVQQKIEAVQANIMNLDLSPDISGYDEDKIIISRLGNGIEYIFEEAEELENDQEKKIMREVELFKQGTVFVEDIWKEETFKEKTFDGKFDGSMTFKWQTRIKEALPHPERTVISGLGVYLGDIRQYFINNQPYIFTAQIVFYDQAAAIFGDWERWKYVPRSLTQTDTDSKDLMYGWKITQFPEGKVEVIRYQDKPNNEYAILVNGILMTPVGLPFLWGFNDYNIVQQNLKEITTTFAYGASYGKLLKSNVAIYDEMLRLGVAKTQKSFEPPMLNLSGKVISKKVMMPGHIISGIPAGSIAPIDPNGSLGVTNAELNFITALRNNNDLNSVSPVFQGAQAQKGSTATEILEVQRQAKMVLGRSILSAQLLEWKLSWLRLNIILKEWFNPIDVKVDDARNVLVNKYRSTTRLTPVDGEGMGNAMVIPTTEPKTAQDVYDQEEKLKESTGIPHRIIFLNPEQIKKAKLTWKIVIRAREKMTNELGKLLFRAELQDAMVFGQSLNWKYMEEKFAQVWNEDPSKLFKAAPTPPVPPDSTASLSVKTPPIPPDSLIK